MSQLPVRADISSAYPIPSNGVARTAMGVIWDVINEMSQAAEIDLASAATVNIGGQVSRKLRITGTTGITSFGTTYTGPIVLRFNGTLTITHHATTLICPGGVNLTVAAGDIVIATPKCTTSGTFDGWMIVARPDSQHAARNGSAAEAFAALAVNTAKTTVASATTPDIFAVTTGQLIDYTGTATCTGFAAAPQAGMFRELYCADACLFTAGANLLIEGIPSGTTITLAAGALVQVRAITTTQFKMTYSVSGTFTATGTGFTANPSGTASFSVNNGHVSLYIPTLTGTSNATTFTITGLPACIDTLSGTGASAGAGVAIDAGANTFCDIQINSVGSPIINLGKGGYAGAWTASGTKTAHFGFINYRII